MDGVITSSFGMRINPVNHKKEFHDGIDIGVGEGTNVFAVSDGIIETVGKSDSFGNFLSYKTNYGYQIFYGHLKKLFVKKNTKVKKNQVVALSGKSGFVSGAHLHYSIRFKNELLDPFYFVDLPFTDDVKNEYAMRGELLN